MIDLFRRLHVPWHTLGLLAGVALLTACPQQRYERDPLTETNVPRPTNEVAEKIPWVTNPPPR